MINRATWVLAGVLVALVALLITVERFSRSVQEIRLAVPGDLTRIVIRNADGEVDLRRTAAGWMVASLDAPASPQRVRALTTRLDPSVAYPVVAGSAAPGRYGLDSAMAVTLYGEQDSATVALGATAADGRSVYARMDVAGAVILMPREVAAAASGPKNAFRDPVVARWPESSIRVVRILDGDGNIAVHVRRASGYGDGKAGDADEMLNSGGVATGAPASAARVERIARQWHVEDAPAGKVEPYQIENMLQELAALTAQEFETDAPTGGATAAPLAMIELQTGADSDPAGDPTGGRQRTLLTIYPATAAGHPATLTGYDASFVLAERRVRRLLMGLIPIS